MSVAYLYMGNATSYHSPIRRFDETICRRFGMLAPAVVGLLPSDGAVNQFNGRALSWSPVPGTGVKYDVYFGTDSTPDDTEFKVTTAATSYNAGTLAAGTTYYWRIDTRTAAGVTTGTIYSFTTASVAVGTVIGGVLSAVWNFNGTTDVTVSDVHGGVELQIFHGGIWNSPTLIADTGGGDPLITATYSFNPSNGVDQYRVDEGAVSGSITGVSFPSSAKVFLPQTGTVDS